MLNSKVGYREAVRMIWMLCATMGKERKSYFVGSLLASLEIINTLLFPFVFQKMVQMVTNVDVNISSNIVAVMIMLAVVLFVIPVVCFGNFIRQRSYIHGKNNMRKKLFSHMQRLSVSEIGKRTTGEYITILSSDVDRAYGLLQGYGIRSLMQFLVIFPVTAGILFWFCPEIAVIAVLFSCFSIWISSVFNPKVSKLGQKAQKQMGTSAEHLMEMVFSFSIVRIFAAYYWLLEKFTGTCLEIFKSRVRYRTLNGIVDGFLNFFQSATQPFTFAIGIYLVLFSRSDIATIVLVSSIAGVMADSSRGVGTFIANMQPPLECARRIFTVLNVGEEPIGEGQPLDLCGDVALSLRNISFSYGTDTKYVLRNFSCDIKTGQFVVFTGPSGCGKSTLFRLIQAMYVPDSGEIVYFGKCGRTLSRENIRQLIAYVPQECDLFEGSIAYNIWLGNPHASMEDVKNAAKCACLDDFILGLKDGYDTMIGEKGTLLSGGQRQRIAIARAFLKNAPILLLDEATSALDAHSENCICTSLHNLMRGRTVLIISHQETFFSDREIRM